MLVGSCTGFVANRMLANYSSEVLSISIRLPILIYILTIQQAKNTSNYRSMRQRAVAQLVKCLTWVQRMMVQASQIRNNRPVTTGGVSVLCPQDTLSTA